MDTDERLGRLEQRLDAPDERLGRLEQRLDALETTISDVREKIAAWAASPAARKLVKMFGVTVP